MRRILITCRQMQDVYPAFADRLADQGFAVDLPAIPGQQFDGDDLLPIIGQYDGAIVGDDVFDRAVLSAARQLRALAKWGVGTDAIDKAAAAELGIIVTNTPGMFNDEVADVTIGYLLMLARQLHVIDQKVREGEWFKPRGWSLRGRTLGVLGLGGIGCETARRAIAMGMVVVGHDPDAAAQARLAALGGSSVELDQLWRRSDVLAINAPLTEQTRHLVNAAALAACKDGVYLINTGRGQIVHEASLVAALESGKVAGVALDVFETEPVPLGSPLIDFPQVILGSHNASNTEDAVLRTSDAAVTNLIDSLAGRS